MIDGMVVVSYLGLLAAKAAGRYVDRRLDRGLEELVGRLAAKFRRNPVDDLLNDPSYEMQRRIARAVDGQARHDRQFAKDLSGIVGRLDGLGGRDVITTVHGNYLHVGRDGDIAYGGNITKIHAGHHPHDLSGVPAWLKALVAIGFLGLLSGVAIIVFSALGLPNGFRSVHEPTDIPMLAPGLATMGVSIALLTITQVIALMVKRH
jgi:hypothetical protein